MVKSTTCSIDECVKAVVAWGWCANHYRRWRLYDDPLGWLPPSGGKPKHLTACSIEGCPEPGPYVRTWCRKHYGKWRTWGDPLRSQHDRDPCTVEGCERDQSARGWCTLHYERWRQEGEPGEAEPRRSAAGDGHLSSSGYRIVTVDGVKWKEHRYVMGQVLGRELRVDEDVHHRNGIRSDNRPENLEVWVRSPGQRVADLVTFVVSHYRADVMRALEKA